MVEKQPAAFYSHDKYSPLGIFEINVGSSAYLAGNFSLPDSEIKKQNAAFGALKHQRGDPSAGLLPVAVRRVSVRAASPRCSQRMLPLQPRGSWGGCGAQPVLRPMTHAHRGYVPFVFRAVKTTWGGRFESQGRDTRAHAGLWTI